MSINAKIIALYGAALLAVGGGVYAVMLDAPTGAGVAPMQMASNDTVAVPAAVAPAAVAPVVADPAKPAAPAPKKLTREQLLPPPMTEAEKLQKAAEQESNF